MAGLSLGEANRLVTMGRGLLAADAAAERAEREAREAAERAAAERAAAEREAAERAAAGVAASESSAGAPPTIAWDDVPYEPLTPAPPRLVPRPREVASGELLARALDSGQIGPDKGDVIRATLADFTIDSRDAEREFVELAPHVGNRKLMKHCFWRLGELDPAGLAAREARHRQERFVSITDQADGKVRIYGLLDVATAAPIKALLDGMSSAAMRRQRKLPKGERVSAGALCADALADVALHALGCTHVPRKPKTTVVVRIDHDVLVDDLRELGLIDQNNAPLTAQARFCSVDGILQPISPGAARLMAVDAQILPEMMGGASLPLDLGDTKRLFTKWQKVAITERDQGCVRCTAPPAFCHGHHIRFWADDGPTNILNAVSLCTGCHHRLHEQHWDLRIYQDRVEIREPGRSWEKATAPPRQRHPRQQPRPARPPLAVGA
ncbi:HNH endonuclease [Demequina sp.]|uniref:HNH endonuclease signature motif containing protein n=1 Tax=Demequina sp. TaxID=2050685 RepID=UPI003D0AA14F